MATYNFTNGSISGQAKQRTRAATENEVYIIRNICDFSKQTLDVSESDIAQCLAIPAGTTVINAWCRIITAEGTGAALDFGYGDDADYWGNSLSMSSTGCVGGAITGNKDPIYFASADTLDLAADGAATVDIDGLKVEVCAMCVKALDSY
jgi:hypothetical protein